MQPNRFNRKQPPNIEIEKELQQTEQGCSFKLNLIPFLDQTSFRQPPSKLEIRLFSFQDIPRNPQTRQSFHKTTSCLQQFSKSYILISSMLKMNKQISDTNILLMNSNDRQKIEAIHEEYSNSKEIQVKQLVQRTAKYLALLQKVEEKSQEIDQKQDFLQVQVMRPASRRDSKTKYVTFDIGKDKKKQSPETQSVHKRHNTTQSLEKDISVEIINKKPLQTISKNQRSHVKKKQLNKKEQLKPKYLEKLSSEKVFEQIKIMPKPSSPFKKIPHQSKQKERSKKKSPNRHRKSECLKEKKEPKKIEIDLSNNYAINAMRYTKQFANKLSKLKVPK